MDLIEATLLGIIQGVTEFLPISSSGHLILGRHLLGIQQESQAAFIFDVLVQMGTWLAVVFYYRKDLAAIATDMLRGLRGQPAPQARLGWLIALATLPAVLVGLLIKDSVANDLAGLQLSGIFLVANAALLLLAEWIGKRARTVDSATSRDAVVIGGFQALALLPAVSRSASALAGGMVSNFTRAEAARFAFLMAVPILPAAALVAFLDLGVLPNGDTLALPLIIGFIASAVVGYLSIRWLLRYLSTRSLIPFAVYCLLLGSIVTLGWLG
jgi:undecaprenyl-diphosphatase